MSVKVMSENKIVETTTTDGTQLVAEATRQVNQTTSIESKNVETELSPDDSEVVEEDSVKYPPRLQLLSLTIALMVTIFTSQLDKSIIGIQSSLGLGALLFKLTLFFHMLVNAIPTITSDFDSLNDVGWYGSAFLLSQMALQPTWGRFYTYFNSKWLYILAIGIFEGGSVACAAAPNSHTLIFGRALAGAGGAGIFGGSLAVVTQIIPLKDRPMYIGAVSCMFGVASLLGPLVGGIIVDSWLTWRFCFWVNLPFGAVTVLIIAFMYKPPPSIHNGLSLKEKVEGLDLSGAFFLICGMTCLLLALQWGGTTYSWRNPRVWGCLIGFVVMTSVFIALQIRSKDKATVPMHIITQRSVAFSYIYATCFSMAIITHTYYMPIYFQAVQQTSATESGIRVLAYGLPITIATMISGVLVTKTGHYVPFMWFGGAVFTTAATLIYTLEVDSTARQWIGYPVLAAVGFGSAIQIPLIAVNNVLPEKDVPTGAALLIFFQSFGGALGLSIAQNTFSTSLEKQLAKLQGVNATTIIAHGASDLKAVVPETILRPVLEGYRRAIQTAFILPIVSAGVAFVVSWGMEWKKMGAKGRQK